MADSIDVASILTNNAPPSVVTLQNTLAAINTYQQEIAAREALANLKASQQEATQKRLVEDTKAANEIAAKLKNQELSESQKTLSQVHDLQRAYGVDPNDAATYMLTTIAEKSRTATEDYMKAAAELQARETVSFFDNPIEWVISQYTIEGQRTLTQDLAKKAQTLDAQLRSMSESVNSGAAQITLANKTLSDAEKADRLKLFTLEADKVLGELELKNFATGISTLQSLNAMTKDQASIALQKLDAKQRERSIAISESHLSLAQAEFAWKQAEKAKDDKVANNMVALVNSGAAGLGDSKTYTWADIQAMRSFPGTKERIDIYFAAGVTNASVAKKENGVSDFRYAGSTPGEAALTLASTRLQGAPGAEKLTQLLKRTVAEVKNEHPEFKDAQIIAAVNSKLIGTQQGNSKVGGEFDRWVKNAEVPGSPIALDNIQLMFDNKAVSKLKETAFYKSSFKTLVEGEKLSKFDINTAVATGAAAVVNKKATLEEASEFFSHLYTVALQQQQIRNNFSGVGLPAINKYRVITDVGSFGSSSYSKPWDATNETQFKHAINMKIRQDSLTAAELGTVFK